MTDNVIISPPSVSPSTYQKGKGIKGGPSWINKVLSWINRPPREHASISMLNLARTNLGVKLRSIDETSLASEHQKKIYAAVTEMLKAPVDTSAITEGRGWDEIYEAESLIALLYNGERLRQVIGECLQDLTDLNKAEADAINPDCQELLKRPVDGSIPGSDDTMLRGCLLRLMEGVHWNNKKKYLVRELHAQATRRILWFLLVSLVLMILPFVVINLDIEKVNWWWSMLTLWTALTAGLFGAFFFRLTDINSRTITMSVDEAALQCKLSYTLLRAGVGVCGALIVYIFLRSGIAEGALFPKFDEIKIELVDVAAGTPLHMAFAMPSKAMALLTFWCFLAGYSEKLVPNILSSAEQRLTEAATPTQTSQKQ
jgi:hypothetical protein